MSESTTHTPDMLRHTVACANIHAGDSVLDVGTGNGVLLPYIADTAGRFGMIDAVDLDASKLAEAHSKYAHLPLAVRFFLADVENDAIQTIYDRIVLLDLLPHLERPMETLLKLFSKNLSGGGTIAIVQLGGREKHNSSLEDADNATHHLPPARQMASRLTDAGLKVDYVEDTPEAYIIRVRRH